MTERLTEYTRDGAVLILNNPRNEQEAREQLMIAYKKAIMKLANYEDIGLSSEQINKLVRDNKD